MMDKISDGIIAVLLAVVGVATMAVIFAPKAKTAEVFTSGGKAFADIIKAAVGPVM